jgi:PAS domain S-box-containing protein
VVDNVPTGIISIDVEGNVNLFNRAAEEILGIQRIDILGRNVSIFQDKLASLLLDTLYTGKRYRREEIFLLPQRILIGVSSSQIYNEKGEIVGAGITFTDLSKIKKEENLQRQKEQMKFWDRLSTFLCHEIKNSILSTTTLTQLLPQKYDDEEFRQTFLSSIMRDTARLDRLTERIKEFANSRVLKPVEGDLLDVLNEAIKDSLQDWKSKSIDIALEIKNRRGVKIPIDYFWLKEAFYNILINALEALGEGGRIRVCVEEFPQEIDEPRLFLGDGMVKVTIEDDGPGISQENLPMVLEPFFSTKEGRIGLGLAISMNVIEGHGGSISISSRWGEGTRVSIYLPKKRRE